MAYPVEDCARTAEVLRQAVASVPASARAVRTTLRTLAREHEAAVKWHGYAEESGLSPEIVPAGGVGSGESIMLPAGRAEVRRVTESGVEFNVDGFWNWHTISSRTAPMVVVTHALDDPGPKAVR
jgi:hypothetical protein